MLRDLQDQLGKWVRREGQESQDHLDWRVGLVIRDHRVHLVNKVLWDHQECREPLEWPVRRVIQVIVDQWVQLDLKELKDHQDSVVSLVHLELRVLRVIRVKLESQVQRVIVDLVA